MARTIRKASRSFVGVSFVFRLSFGKLRACFDFASAFDSAQAPPSLRGQPRSGAALRQAQGAPARAKKIPYPISEYGIAMCKLNLKRSQERFYDFELCPRFWQMFPGDSWQDLQELYD